MRIILRIIAGLALLALALWLWSVLFPGPEKRIRQRLEAAAQAASFGSGEGPLVIASNVSKLTDCFSQDAEISFDAPGHGRQTLNGREEIQQVALGARQAIGSLKVEFLDLNITVANDKQSADVDLTAKGKVRGEANFYVQEMKFTLKQINGDWLITRIETVKTLK